MGIVKLGEWGAGRFANRPYGGMDSGSGTGITEGEGRYETCPTWEGGLPWLGCEAIEVYSVEAQYVGLGVGGEGFQALSQLIDGAEHALRVGEIGAPHELVRPEPLDHQGGELFVGVHGGPDLPLKILAGVHRHLVGPGEGIEYAVHPFEPVEHPSTARLEEHDLEVGEPIEDASGDHAAEAEVNGGGLLKHEIPDIGVGEVIEGGVGEVRVVEGVEPADNVQGHGYLKLFSGRPKWVEGGVSVGAAVQGEATYECGGYTSLRNPAQLSGAFRSMSRRVMWAMGLRRSGKSLQKSKTYSL